MAECHISLRKTYASSDAQDWFMLFDICRRANGWDPVTNTLKLTMLLEGEALALWSDLKKEQHADYDTNRKSFNTIMPTEFVSLNEFK